MTNIIGILATLMGVGIIAIILNRWVGRITFGVLGLILILQPVGSTLYSPVDPRYALLSVVLGIFVLVADVRKHTKKM